MLLYHIYICFQIKRPKKLYFFVQIKKYLGIIYYYVHLHIRQCLAKQCKSTLQGDPILQQRLVLFSYTNEPPIYDIASG